MNAARHATRESFAVAAAAVMDRAGPRMLATVLSASANGADKAVALNELWRLRCPELVQAIKAQAACPPLTDLVVGLYTMARDLPIEVLMKCAARRMTSILAVQRSWALTTLPARRAQFLRDESIVLFRDDAGPCILRSCG